MLSAGGIPVGQVAELEIVFRLALVKLSCQTCSYLDTTCSWPDILELQ